MESFLFNTAVNKHFLSIKKFFQTPFIQHEQQNNITMLLALAPIVCLVSVFLLIVSNSNSKCISFYRLIVKQTLFQEMKCSET